MRTRRISSAVICFARVLGITPSGLHLPISRPDGQESIVSRDPNAEGRQLLPQKTSETEFHTLRHNISYDQESPCLWSTNHTKQYCVFADQQFDNGQGIILITTRERAPHFFDYIASTSAGRRGSTRDPLYRTVATEVKGRGIFANRHIPAGTLITQESPIIFQDQNWVDDVDSEEARTALQELAFDKLPFATSQIAKEFYGGDGGRQKVTVNSYGLPGRPTEDWPWLEDDSDHGIMSAHANISVSPRYKKEILSSETFGKSLAEDGTENQSQLSSKCITAMGLETTRSPTLRSPRHRRQRGNNNILFRHHTNP